MLGRNWTRSRGNPPDAIPQQYPIRIRCQSNKQLDLDRALRNAVTLPELLFLGAGLMAFWLMNAASVAGYVLLSLFVLITLVRALRSAIGSLAAQLPRRSQLRRYLLFGTSAVFFCLLAMRGCYIAAVIVDTQFRADPLRAESY